MRTGSRHAVMAGALLLAGGCTLAQMQPPAAPEDAMETAILRGISSKDGGSFDLAGAHGNFVRGSGAFREDIRLHIEGESQFTLWGDGVDGRLSGDCGSYASEVGNGTLSINDVPLSYRCRFERDGAPIDARLELVEPPPAKAFGLAPIAPREGLIFFRGRRMDLKSVHQFQGSRHRSGMPMGYAFIVDGREIGGIDLANAPYRVYLPRDPAYREAALAASLSLALFREPDDVVRDQEFQDRTNGMDGGTD